YQPVDLAARLSLQAAWRQPIRPAQHLPQPADHDAARRNLARRRVEVRDVGGDAWRRAGGRAHAHYAAAEDPGRQDRLDGRGIPFRLPHLDFLPGRGFHRGKPVHWRPVRRMERWSTAGRAVHRRADPDRDGRPVHPGEAVRAARRAAGARAGMEDRRAHRDRGRAGQRARPRGGRAVYLFPVLGDAARTHLPRRRRDPAAVAPQRRHAAPGAGADPDRHARARPVRLAGPAVLDRAVRDSGALAARGNMGRRDGRTRPHPSARNPARRGRPADRGGMGREGLDQPQNLPALGRDDFPQKIDRREADDEALSLPGESSRVPLRAHRTRAYSPRTQNEETSVFPALNDTQRQFVATIRELAQSEFRERAPRYQDGTFPWENMKPLAELGVLGMAVPEEYGGLGLP